MDMRREERSGEEGLGAGESEVGSGPKETVGPEEPAEDEGGGMAVAESRGGVSSEMRSSSPDDRDEGALTAEAWEEAGGGGGSGDAGDSSGGKDWSDMWASGGVGVLLVVD